MNHNDKNGQPKIVETCTLPLTSRRCIDLIITDIAVFQVKKEHLLLTEIFSPFTIDDVQRKTGCMFKISEDLIQIS